MSDPIANLVAGIVVGGFFFGIVFRLSFPTQHERVKRIMRQPRRSDAEALVRLNAAGLLVVKEEYGPRRPIFQLSYTKGMRTFATPWRGSLAEVLPDVMEFYLAMEAMDPSFASVPR